MLVEDLAISTEPPEFNQVWYSGAGDKLDRMLVGHADLAGMEEATLTFDTMYQIEDYWDFGFVQGRYPRMAVLHGSRWRTSSPPTKPVINGALIDDGDEIVGLSPAYPSTDWMVTIYCPANGICRLWSSIFA